MLSDNPRMYTDRVSRLCANVNGSSGFLAVKMPCHSPQTKSEKDSQMYYDYKVV